MYEYEINKNIKDNQEIIKNKMDSYFNSNFYKGKSNINADELIERKDIIQIRKEDNLRVKKLKQRIILSFSISFIIFCILYNFLSNLSVKNIIAINVYSFLYLTLVLFFESFYKYCGKLNNLNSLSKC